MSQVTYRVPGISCDHCKNAIEAGVASVAGVSKVVVDVANRTVVIDGGASDSALRAAIEEAGYEVGP